MKYLRFASIQRNVQVKDLMSDIDDFKDSRIQDDDTFSSEVCVRVCVCVCVCVCVVNVVLLLMYR